jgi:hypothetical protein
MTERRSLTEGLKPQTEIDRTKEKEFVYGTPPETAPASPTAAASGPVLSAPHPHRGHSRSPLTTRIRSDYAEALKKASLERQLRSEEPYTVQDILENALEPWLRDHGYLK